MSLSWIALKPLIEEPSSLPIPFLKSSASTVSEGTVMCCSPPVRSTNWRSRNLTPSSLTLSTTSAGFFTGFFEGIRNPSRVRSSAPPDLLVIGMSVAIYNASRQIISRLSKDIGQIVFIRLTPSGTTARYIGQILTTSLHETRGRPVPFGRSRRANPPRPQRRRPALLPRTRSCARRGHRHGQRAREAPRGRWRRARLRPPARAQAPRPRHRGGDRDQDLPRSTPRGPAKARKGRAYLRRVRRHRRVGLHPHGPVPEHARTGRVHQAPACHGERGAYVHAGRPQRGQAGDPRSGVTCIISDNRGSRLHIPTRPSAACPP